MFEALALFFLAPWGIKGWGNLMSDLQDDMDAWVEAEYRLEQARRKSRP